MENQLQQVGRRIREARTVLDISVAEMAKLHHMTEEEYLRYENGEADPSFMFLFRCANRFGMDPGALATGESPKLSFYTLTRAGTGLNIRPRRAGFEYLHQAAHLKNRLAEPFIVTAPFVSEDEEIHLTTHPGQEFDYILKGTLRCRFEDKTEVLHAGDSVFYDSGHPHGMVAADGEECVFLVVVIKNGTGEAEAPVEWKKTTGTMVQRPERDFLYKRFMEETLDEKGLLKAVKFHIPENFNFAYDVIDELAKKNPEKRAMLWISEKHEVREFTFRDFSEMSARAANYFTSLGVRKGDMIMLVLKRHWQFWVALLALHRIGAVAIPATSQLLTKDYVYRFKSAKVKGIVCTAEDGVPGYVEEAEKEYGTLKVRILANGEREGWRTFEKEIGFYSDRFERLPDQKASDPMLMYFSSGTSGYPKMVLHAFSYPIGHIVTARWWHNVDPDGMHLSIADTGWAKAGWGKIYGQWICETCQFIYDFRKFQPADILPLFKKYNLTTFCAPPTMYRFFIKEDLSKFDFSSIKYACTAGEALNAEVFQQFLSATGLKIMEGFGQTESPLLLGNLVGMTPKPGSMGKPSPQFHIDLMDADGNSVPAGEVGEIVIKAEPGEVPGLFLGYYCAPDKNAESWHDGWYHTGDTAWRDEDGYYWYVGRVDDVIKSSGYRIGPFEIESVLMELPYVLECAVTGAPDPIRGQVVKATIVLVKGKEGSEELKKEIQTYVKTHTAPYKYPRLIEFVKELPKTVSGKIRRVALREKSRKEAGLPPTKGSENEQK